MKPGIKVTKVDSDEDVVELNVDVCDGTSLFSINVYVGYQVLTDTISGLDVFKNHLHGGLFDLQWGAFGPEYAKGALHARLHFHGWGARLYITCKLQSDYKEFSLIQVASEATLYLKSQAVLLDDFISELKRLKAGTTEEAWLEAI
jgi:hypothetical protein